VQIKSRRLSVGRPGFLKRPCRFSRGHAEASQRRYRGANTDVGIGATFYVPARGTLEDRIGMCRVERMRPSNSSSSSRRPSRASMDRSSRQYRRRCSTISGNQTRCASPAATAHHLRLVPGNPLGWRPSPDRRFPRVIPAPRSRRRDIGRTGPAPRRRVAVKNAMIPLLLEVAVQSVPAPA
jgi:hypothetical protein